MNFESPSAVENVVFDCLLADYPRARNRAKINQLFNGVPPFSEREVIDNQLETNYNDLTGTEIAQKVRGNFYNALVAPSPLVDVELDYGPVYKRKEWADVITRELNKRLKRSLKFKEQEESVFAQVVLHGRGPSIWEDNECWCPRARGIEDVLVPGGTYRDLSNLPFVAVYEQYTAAQLYKCISGPHVDPGWNIPLAKALCQWAYENVGKLAGTIWPDPWRPEKWEERIKDDAGLFASDRTPTIDTYHLYYWCDEKKQSGWRKKIILDSWGQPGTGGIPTITANKYKDLDKHLKNKVVKSGGAHGMFLYDGGSRIYGRTISEVAHWQFGDCSPVAPFTYHGVRGLGFMLYAVCDFQNRFNCSFYDNVFENMSQYFSLENPNDVDRVTQIELGRYRAIPPGVKFVTQGDRWQMNAQTVEMATNKLRETLGNVSGAFLQQMDSDPEASAKTATETMMKAQSISAMVSNMLARAYDYQVFKYREIGRRFCIRNSRDVEVRQFRASCFKQGVPVEALNVERWNMTPTRVIGGGQKVLQIAQADKLMGTVYDKLDGDGQQELKRTYIAINSDYDTANRLAPPKKQISSTVNKAQNDAGTLMQGIPVTPEEGTNHIDYIETQLHAMATLVAGIMQTGGTSTQQQVMGLANLGNNIATHIRILGQDKKMKQKVKIYSDDLGKMMNQVKAFAQRLQEQQKSQGQNGAIDVETMGKVRAMTITAQAKAKLAAESHAQKTAQRQLAFEQKVKQDAIQHQADLAKTDLEAAANIRRGRMESFDE